MFTNFCEVQYETIVPGLHDKKKEERFSYLQRFTLNHPRQTLCNKKINKGESPLFLNLVCSEDLCEEWRVTATLIATNNHTLINTTQRGKNWKDAALNHKTFPILCSVFSKTQAQHIARPYNKEAFLYEEPLVLDIMTFHSIFLRGYLQSRSDV